MSQLVTNKRLNTSLVFNLAPVLLLLLKINMTDKMKLIKVIETNKNVFHKHSHLSSSLEQNRVFNVHLAALSSITKQLISFPINQHNHDVQS